MKRGGKGGWGEEERENCFRVCRGPGPSGDLRGCRVARGKVEGSVRKGIGGEKQRRPTRCPGPLRESKGPSLQGQGRINHLANTWGNSKGPNTTLRAALGPSRPHPQGHMDSWFAEHLAATTSRAFSFPTIWQELETRAQRVTWEAPGMVLAWAPGGSWQSCCVAVGTPPPLGVPQLSAEGGGSCPGSQLSPGQGQEEVGLVSRVHTGRAQLRALRGPGWTGRQLRASRQPYREAAAVGTGNDSRTRPNWMPRHLLAHA